MKLYINEGLNLNTPDDKFAAEQLIAGVPEEFYEYISQADPRTFMRPYSRGTSRTFYAIDERKLINELNEWFVESASGSPYFFVDVNSRDAGTKVNRYIISFIEDGTPFEIGYLGIMNEPYGFGGFVLFTDWKDKDIDSMKIEFDGRKFTFDDGVRWIPENKTRKSRSRRVNEDFENRAWAVWEYNDADAEFGYDPGPHIVEGNLTREYAEQRAEELEAQNPHEFIHYYADQEPTRWT